MPELTAALYEYGIIDLLSTLQEKLGVSRQQVIDAVTKELSSDIDVDEQTQFLAVARMAKAAKNDVSSGESLDTRTDEEYLRDFQKMAHDIAEGKYEGIGF